MTTPTPLLPPTITEEDIVQYLLHNAEFFERNIQVLTTVRLTSPYGARAVSLQERQAEMLRDKIKILERRVLEMMRHGDDNLLLTDKLLLWAKQLFLVSEPAQLPSALITAMMTQFNVPQATLRLWDVDPSYDKLPFTQGVDEQVRSFATSLVAPYCGINSGFEVLSWLDDPKNVASIALIPLRKSEEDPAFGLMILASPDGQRYEAGMATDLLERLGELTSAALLRLKKP